VNRKEWLAYSHICYGPIGIGRNEPGHAFRADLKVKKDFEKEQAKQKPIVSALGKPGRRPRPPPCL
jgi:hypothetical protein